MKDWIRPAGGLLHSALLPWSCSGRRPDGSLQKRECGVTDTAEKGIETFFCNHCCNKFCNSDGRRWQRPRDPTSWFESSEGTSMFSSSKAHLLNLNSSARFTVMDGIMECEEDEYSDDGY